MRRDKRGDKHELDEEETAVPFTARLNAYYRAQEFGCEFPLLRDPLAKRLAGDMTPYFEEHKRFAEMGGLQITRSYYIENELLTPWCEKHKRSQIVLLGAGLDTRAYRFEPLQSNFHTIFEIDFPLIIKYKKKILKNEHPLCDLVRLSANLSNTNWSSKLKNRGFSNDIPTFWILEGLVYYLEQNDVRSILKNACEISAEESEIFVDVCVPAIAGLDWGPFSSHFKWGLDKQEIPSFFAFTGWDVTSSYADDHDHGRDVGQKGIIYVTGLRDFERLGEIADTLQLTTAGNEGENLQLFSINLTKKILPDIEKLVSTFTNDVQEGLSTYLEFVKGIKHSLETLAKAHRDPVSLGRISPRLLGDPFSIEREAEERSSEEIESYITEYLKAILFLTYCGATGIEGDQFHDTTLFQTIGKMPSTGNIESILPIIELIRRELKIT